MAEITFVMLVGRGPLLLQERYMNTYIHKKCAFSINIETLVLCFLHSNQIVTLHAMYYNRGCFRTLHAYDLSLRIRKLLVIFYSSS